MVHALNSDPLQTTIHKVVTPFYLYAALSFLAATTLLLFSTEAFSMHYFHPHTLAITHAMALGWGTMIILGASHQLIPVLIGSNLYSYFLAYLSFILAALGIPLLVYAFYTFQFNWLAITGAVLINLAVLSYLVNLYKTISRAKSENVHSVFIFTAACWLLATTIIGLLLTWNMSDPILPQNSIEYLSLHAHIGLAGWFLLLILGVASRLIPMFLISKYDDPRKLWQIYFVANSAIVSFIILFFTSSQPVFYLLPVSLLAISLGMFGLFTYRAYKERIRKQVDEQMKLSLFSVAVMVIPVAFILLLILLLMRSVANEKLVLVYGFSIFFGWITAIIFGMTFKTLPFIIWNKVYHAKAGATITPTPKDLFHAGVFNYMSWFYIAGFLLFAAGILASLPLLIRTATVFLLVTAVLYNWNVIKLINHKPLIK